MLSGMISETRRCTFPKPLRLRNQQPTGGYVFISLAHLAASDLDGETDVCSIFSQSLVRNGLVAALVLGLIAFLAVKQATKGRQAAQPADSPQVARLTHAVLC